MEGLEHENSMSQGSEEGPNDDADLDENDKYCHKEK